MKRGDIFTKTKQNSQKGYQNGKWSQAGKNWFGWQGEGKKETQEEAKEIKLTHCASNALHVMALRTNRRVLTGGHTREVTVRIKAKQAKLLSNKYRTIERLLLNHANTPGFLAPGGEEFNPGPETRLDRSELLCNKVLLKYKGDRESF